MESPRIKIRELPEDIDQGKIQDQKEENHEEKEIKEVSTKIPDSLIYEDLGLYELANILIEEYLTKVNQSCELAERLDAIDFENGLIQTQ